MIEPPLKLVTMPAVLHLQAVGGPAIPVKTTLVYGSTDPFAVLLAMSTGTEVVEWHVARDVLRDGISRPAGVGDVRVCPSEYPGELTIRIMSGDGEATFSVATVTVCDFLFQTYELVPAGYEVTYLDLDAELLDLVGGDHA